MKKILLIPMIPFICIFFVISNHTLDYSFYKTQENEKVQITRINLSNELGIDGYVNMIKLSKNCLSYTVTDNGHRNYDFYMNANYFTIDDIPVGEVIINGKNVQHKNKNGGFFTSNGKTPSFYFNKRPNNVLYSSETHTPIIIDGKPNNKIFNKKWAKSKFPRLIIGENKNKDIIILHTIDDTRCSVEDFYKISQKQGLVNALMFDGGASIEVGVRYKDVKYNYQIVSDIERILGKVPTPSVFIVGNFD
jgi:hypothetical protein